MRLTIEQLNEMLKERGWFIHHGVAMKSVTRKHRRLVSARIEGNRFVLSTSSGSDGPDEEISFEIQSVGELDLQAGFENGYRGRNRPYSPEQIDICHPYLNYQQLPKTEGGGWGHVRRMGSQFVLRNPVRAQANDVLRQQMAQRSEDERQARDSRMERRRQNSWRTLTEAIAAGRRDLAIAHLIERIGDESYPGWYLQPEFSAFLRWNVEKAKLVDGRFVVETSLGKSISIPVDGVEISVEKYHDLEDGTVIELVKSIMISRVDGEQKAVRTLSSQRDADDYERRFRDCEERLAKKRRHDEITAKTAALKEAIGAEKIVRQGPRMTITFRNGFELKVEAQGYDDPALDVNGLELEYGETVEV